MWPFHRKSRGVGSGNSPASRAGDANLRQNQPPAPAPVVAIQQETKKLDAMADMAGSFGKMAEAVDKIRGYTDPVAEETMTSSDMDGLAAAINGPTAQIAIQFIAPYLPGLIEKYTGVKPVSIPPTGLPSPEVTPPVTAANPSTAAVPGGFGADRLIKEMARCGEKEARLKLIAAEGYLKATGSSLDAEFAKAGTTREDLKNAGYNISRVL